MHIQSIIVSVLLVGSAVTASRVNEPCIGANNAAGVCVSTSDCSKEGGTSISNACPGTPDDVKCCTKPKCGSGTTAGNCRWASDCGGTTAANQCPGPAGFKCCNSAASGFGGYKAPSFPPVGECKQVAVDGAKKIVAAFPGRVREIFCTRACKCGSGSDHCCGKATDMMCSDAGGTPTVSGQTIAEWVMNNRGPLNLKYVIWGERIWNPSRDKVGGWESWRPMEDRGDITANHWDHVHVSYN